MATGGKNRESKVQARVRRQQAVQLRIAGHTYERIAETLGMRPSSVHKTVQAAMEETREQTKQDTESLRALELARIHKHPTTITHSPTA